MKIVAPDYYKQFHCIAGHCKHSCCKGWEIDIDEDSLQRFESFPEIRKKISYEGVPHFILKGKDCPFLRKDNLCQMIIEHGEDFLCQICKDHPRFRNFWTGRIEIGLGLACEEAARIILSQKKPMTLITLEEDGEENLPEDEAWLMKVRDGLLSQVEDCGPSARLLEYLIYRHIADALYDDRLEERLRFVQSSYDEILDAWEKTDGSLETLVEIARDYSVRKEYVVADEDGCLGYNK